MNSDQSQNIADNASKIKTKIEALEEDPTAKNLVSFFNEEPFNTELTRSQILDYLDPKKYDAGTEKDRITKLRALVGAMMLKNEANAIKDVRKKVAIAQDDNVDSLSATKLTSQLLLVALGEITTTTTGKDLTAIFTTDVFQNATKATLNELVNKLGDQNGQYKTKQLTKLITCFAENDELIIANLHNIFAALPEKSLTDIVTILEAVKKITNTSVGADLANIFKDLSGIATKESIKSFVTLMQEGELRAGLLAVLKQCKDDMKVAEFQALLQAKADTASLTGESSLVADLEAVNTVATNREELLAKFKLGQFKQDTKLSDVLGCIDKTKWSKELKGLVDVHNSDTVTIGGFLYSLSNLKPGDVRVLLKEKKEALMMLTASGSLMLNSTNYNDATTAITGAATKIFDFLEGNWTAEKVAEINADLKALHAQEPKGQEMSLPVLQQQSQIHGRDEDSYLVALTTYLKAAKKLNLSHVSPIVAEVSTENAQQSFRARNQIEIESLSQIHRAEILNEVKPDSSTLADLQSGKKIPEASKGVVLIGPPKKDEAAILTLHKSKDDKPFYMVSKANLATLKENDDTLLSIIGDRPVGISGVSENNDPYPGIVVYSLLHGNSVVETRQPAAELLISRFLIPTISNPIDVAARWTNLIVLMSNLNPQSRIPANSGPTPGVYTLGEQRLKINDNGTIETLDDTSPSFDVKEKLYIELVNSVLGFKNITPNDDLSLEAKEFLGQLDADAKNDLSNSNALKFLQIVYRVRNPDPFENFKVRIKTLGDKYGNFQKVVAKAELNPHEEITNLQVVERSESTKKLQ